MSAVLRTRIDANVLALGAAGVVGSTEQLANAAVMGAYADCFGMMALAAIVISPGILVFRARGCPIEAATAALVQPSADVH